MEIFQIYLLIGFLIMGLIDLYLSSYPIFHPIVVLPILGWFWGEMSVGLIVGGILELVFGVAQIKNSRRLNLILYAGGLGIFFNDVSNNINLIFCLTLGLLIALGIGRVLITIRDEFKWVILLISSLAIIYLIPFASELPGLLPAKFLNQISIAGGILPWIFFAYSIWGLTSKGRDREIILIIPAVLVGSILNLKTSIFTSSFRLVLGPELGSALRPILGPVVFLFLYYFFELVFKKRDVKILFWVDWILIGLSIYLLLPDFTWTTLGIFAALLGLNTLLVIRKFSPLEIYLLTFLIGIVLSQGRLLL